jgi:uncharacterized membrane protein
MGNGIRYFSAGPLSVLAIIILIGLVVLIIPLLVIGVIGKAFTALGFSWITALALVLLMLMGSLVNIPVYRVKRDVVRLSPDTQMMYESGAASGSDQAWETVIALNLGGAILPLALSGYLLYRAATVTGQSLLIPVGLGILAVTCIAYAATRVIPGAGIHVPLLMPALTALLVALLVSGGITGTSAAVPALASGVIGTLLGGNIARIPGIKDSGIPLFSIGGSGTFASVFICCILPALIA